MLVGGKYATGIGYLLCLPSCVARLAIRYPHYGSFLEVWSALCDLGNYYIERYSGEQKMRIVLRGLLGEETVTT